MSYEVFRVILKGWVHQICYAITSIVVNTAVVWWVMCVTSQMQVLEEYVGMNLHASFGCG